MYPNWYANGRFTALLSLLYAATDLQNSFKKS